MDYYNEQELYHFGIKGMKWGVRRYQNADGTLTAKGKKRYSEGESKVSSAGKKVGKAAGKVATKAVERYRKKTEKRQKSYNKTTEIFGIYGAAARAASEYKAKKAVKGLAVNVINSAANAYISNNHANYRISRGVDFVRRASIGALSLSARMDQINAVATVGRSYVYATRK